MTMTSTPTAAIKTEEPLRSCDTCAHQLLGDHSDAYSQRLYARCMRFGSFCSTVRMSGRLCDANWSGWTPRTPVPPKPPRRSLFQWARDTFWKLES